MMKTKWTVLFLLILFSAALAKASAAEPIRGAVTDTSGGVIGGATVQLFKGDRLIFETRTTSTGAFSLPAELSANAGGGYSVLAAAGGFSPASRALAAGTPGQVTLVLEVAPYRQSVEITAKAPPQQALLDIGGVRESAAKDLGEALAALDGVWKIRKAGIANDLVVRGFQQNNINVLVDGTRTYGACPSHMDPPAQHVDFAEVDHVELTKGAFDVANQGSLGAVVNIVTRAPGIGFTVKPSFAAGSFGFYNPSVTASWGNRVFRVLGGYSFRTSDPYSDGSGRRFIDYAAYSAVGKSRRAFDINTGWLETQVSLSSRQQISLGYTRQQAGLILYPYLSMDSDYDNADRASVKYAARDLSSLIRALRVESYLTQVKHFMSDSQRMSAMMGSWMMASNATTRAIGGRVEADLGRDVTAGIESYNRNWNVAGYMKMNGMTTFNPTVPDVNTQTAGAFLNYRHHLSERLRLTGGVRFDHARMLVEDPRGSTNLYYQFHNTRRTRNDDNYGSGNVRLSLGLAGGTELFAGLGSTARLPDAEERYISRGMGSGATVGNPLLPVTRNTELAAGWSLIRTRVQLRPSFFYSYLNDSFFYSYLNDYIMVNNQPQLNALGMGSGMGMGLAAVTARSYTGVDARIYGGEMGWGLTFTDSISLNGGGSYSRGAAALAPAANVRSRNLPEMPPLRAWSALRYMHRWAFAEFGATAVNRQPLVNSDLREQPTGGYGLMNVKMGFTHKHLSGSFTLDNLANHYYYEHLSYYRDPFASGVKVPEPGRSFFVQLRCAF
jgi:iron complex outermembrane recepter protein